MILVDTSIWIDHLRDRDDALVELLVSGRVLCHPCVIGELALGNLRHRDEVLRLLHGLPRATVATDGEVLTLVGRESLHGRGIGYVDAHVVASARLTAHATLWTRDKCLSGVASQLGVGAGPDLS
ncbi:type II toxin-antitoxin system VapC family toxin [Jiangella asiatica]|uniref:Ribonuclease VapC n=1 Tax=Jiangella asiatica TaxID=2530372 RepID=A0A4R5DG46_9ACTN|nr:PIN domain-containing protein [Jiangella asiatica]TDE09655.1 type II toxin-antitoxin system VapC family toxin [Jiangella asiatica]